MGNNARIRRRAKAAKRAAAKQAARTKQKATIGQTQQKRLLTPPPLHRRLFRATTWAIASVVGLIGLASGIDSLWGPPWPTDPDIHANGSDPGAPFSLPFSVKNNSGIFAMHADGFGCLIDKLETTGGGVMSNVNELRPAKIVISPRGGVFNFSCHVARIPSELVKTEPAAVNRTVV